MNKKILFVTDCLSEGGAEKAVSNFANGISVLGYDVSVLIFRKTENEYPLYETVQIVRLPQELRFADKSVFERNIRRLPAVRNIFKTLRPDFIFAFMEGNIIVSLLASFLLPYKVIAGIRCDQKSDKGIYPPTIRDFFTKLCFKIFCQNKIQIEYYSKRIQKKCFAVPNPIADKFIEVGKTREYRQTIVNITAIGRLEKQKNFQLLIKAFTAVSQKYPFVLLSIYGEGSLRSDLEAMIRESACEKRIMLRGWTNNVANVLVQSDLFILSSDYEGMPNTLMEAMACGVPCITTDCPTGPNELIENNVTGLLIPVNDSTKLIEAMDYMLSHPDKAKAMGENAHAFVGENYNLNKVCIKLIENIMMN